jgi:nitroimidazol reductase NimA-like FMN-containing flavoprotein (pyridoxamine 5'-phosphate oxidase superfamily)
MPDELIRRAGVAGPDAAAVPDQPAFPVSGWAADPVALAAFLREPNLCRVATLDGRGRPHVVPAWFWWDGTRFHVGAQASDAKVAHVRRFGEAGIEIDADVRQKRGIYATGSARIIDGPEGREEYIRISIEQMKRYRPERPARETAERMAATGEPVVIMVTPRQMISWGR